MKVFSKKKHDDVLGSPYDDFKWTLECDGKTKEECASLGYSVVDKWCVERVYNTMTNVGSSKYVVNYHDGESTHRDGSPFYGIATFSSKKKMEKFITGLIKKGYSS